MNIAEAKAKFPVGSMVKVTDDGGVYSAYDTWAKKNFSGHDFLEWRTKSNVYVNTGDIGMVIAVDYHNGTYGETEILVGIHVEGKRPFIMNARNIEPYDPPFDDAVIPAKEAAPRFKTCDGSKGYEVLFDGSNLIVTAHGETIKRNIEELLDEIFEECWKKSREIKAGDTVKITDCEECYPNIIKWLEANATFEQAVRFDWNGCPKNDDLATVLLVAPHQVSGNTLYMVEIEHDDVFRIYVMNRDGIEKI